MYVRYVGTITSEINHIINMTILIISYYFGRFVVLNDVLIFKM